MNSKAKDPVQRARPGASDDIAGYVPGDEYDEDEVVAEEEPVPKSSIR